VIPIRQANWRAEWQAELDTDDILFGLSSGQVLLVYTRHEGFSRRPAHMNKRFKFAFGPPISALFDSCPDKYCTAALTTGSKTESIKLLGASSRVLFHSREQNSAHGIINKIFKTAGKVWEKEVTLYGPIELAKFNSEDHSLIVLFRCRRGFHLSSCGVYTTIHGALDWTSLFTGLPKHFPREARSHSWTTVVSIS
jgi:hypothetical protein